MKKLNSIALLICLIVLTSPVQADRKVPLRGTPVDRLNANAAKSGVIRVIVGLQLTEEEQVKEKKPAASKAAKEKFFKRHPDIKVSKGHDYEGIPFFATDVDVRKLAEIAADSEVSS